MNPTGTEPDDPEGGRFAAELDSLFADERFDIQPTPGAVQRVLADAKRRRYRRKVWTTTGATLGAGVLLTGLVFSGLLSPREQPEEQQAAAPDTTSEPASVVATPEGDPHVPEPSPESRTPESVLEEPEKSPHPKGLPAPELVLGPHGYRSLDFGMSWEEASQTGLLAEDRQAPPEQGECAHYRLADHAETIEEVIVSGTHGIVGFRAGTAQTEQGVGPGTPLGQAHEAYPDLAREGARYSAPTTTGRYLFAVEDQLVTEVWLIADGSDCWP